MAQLPLRALLGLSLLAAAGSRAAADVVVVPAAGSAREHRGHHRKFKDVAAWAGVFDSPGRDAWQKPDEVLRALRVRPGMVVAEVGSGTGYFAVRLSKAVSPGGTVYAGDVDPAMLAWLRDRADRMELRNIVPVLDSEDDSRLPARAVDLILLADVWHHIENRAEYDRRLKSALRPGGRVAVLDFKKEKLPVGPPPILKLTPVEAQADFRAAGYTRASAPRLLPYQYLLVFQP